MPAPRNIVVAMTILIVLLFSKNAYTSGFTSYYTFYLIERFHVTVQVSQLMLFLYLVVGAVGVIVGGNCRGSDRARSCDLAFDLRRTAIRASSALRGPALDRRSERPH